MEVKRVESPTDTLLRLVSECERIGNLAHDAAEGLRNTEHTGGGWIDFHTPDVSASMLRDMRTTVRTLKEKLDYLDMVLGIGAGN